MGLGIGIGISPTLMTGGAQNLFSILANEPDGGALDLLGGQARVKDTATPANAFSGKLRDLLTYSSNATSQANPYPKLQRKADGLWRYQAHNYFLNSGAPVTQTIGALGQATYEVSVVGSGSVVVSGAASGTVTEGSPLAFTAATTSIVCTVSGSLSRVHVRRTPSESEYIETGATAKFDLPYGWDADGNPLGFLPETQVSSLALWASDFTNAVWVKTNVTAAKTATGPTGVANSASTLTATADGGTALQSITSGSSARRTSCFVKRRAGSGAIEMTQDGGTTWVPVTANSGWARVDIPIQTVTNPVVGFRFATSGDAIDVALFNTVASAAANLTSPIEVFNSAANATRSGDYIYLSATKFKVGASGGTLYVSGECSEASNKIMVDLRSSTGASNERFQCNPAQQLFSGQSTSVTTHSQGPADVISPMPTGQVIRRAASFALNDFRMVQDGSFAVADTSGAFQAEPFERIAIGGNGGGGGANNPDVYIREVVYLPRSSTDAELAAMHVPKASAEKAAAIHFVGDSFLNTQGILQGIRTNNPRRGTALRMVTKDGVGGSSLAQQAARFAATPWYWDHTLVIVDGGLSDAQADAIASVQDMASHLTHDRWLYLQAGFPDRTVSQAFVDARLAVDAALAAAFGSHYVDTYNYVRANGTGSTVGSGGGEVWPLDSCISASDGHPSAQGEALLIAIINAELISRGW